MATQAKVQSAARKRTPSKKPQPASTGLSSIALRGREFLQGLFPSIDISERLKREALGVAMVALAIVSSWAIGRGQSDGAVIAWWGRVITATLGSGAFLVPVFAALCAVRTFATTSGPIVLFRHTFGALMFGVAVIVLLSFGDRGGFLGAFLGNALRAVLGDLVSGLVAFIVGAAGVFLVANTDVRTLVHDVRALIPTHPKEAKQQTSAPLEPVTLKAAGRGLRNAVAVAQEVDVQSTGRLPRPAGRTLNEVLTGNKSSADKDRSSVDHAVVATTPAKAVASASTITEIAPPAKQSAPVINLPSKPKQGKVDDVPAPVDTPGATAVQAGLPMPMPSLTALRYFEQVTPDAEVLEEKAEIIEETLKSFKVRATVREINPGPAVTQFALEPGNGVKVRRITELQSDLALALAAQSIRVEAPIPGMARVGIEIPNPQIATVGLREVLESQEFRTSKAKLPLPLGRDVNGRYIVGDLTKMPHLLIAGATGSGKSVCINAVISTLISTMQPDDLKLLMIDPKMVELVGYNGVPHLQCPVVTEMDKVVSALRMVLREMNRRYELFKDVGVRNLDGYRVHMKDEPDAEKLPYLVVIIDELADLMMTTPDEVETLLARLTQMARATGIHLIIATQRPSVNVLTGLIKANVPARIAFAVSSMTDSRVVLDMPGAERLLGRGDMLYLPPDEAKPTRIQGAYIDEEVKLIVDHWKSVAPIPHYASEWLDLPSSNQGSSGSAGGFGDDAGDEDEPLFQQALDVVKAQGTASASMLQRRLRIGYNRAARIIEQMEEEGYIGPADGARGRPVLVRFEEPDLD